MGKFKGRPTIEEPEFSDLVCAIQASWSTRNTNIIFKGDNAATINNANFKQRFHYYMSTVSCWKEMFTCYKFQHTKRINNILANSLARKSFMLSVQLKLFYDCPQFLVVLVNNDNELVF